MEENKVGRPTSYSEEILVKAREYLNNPLPEDEVIHSIEGLALYINIRRSTIYDWISQEDKKEFSDIVNAVLEKQGRKLINKGLDGTFNSSISKVILTKHGYREGIDQTTNNKDLPTPIMEVRKNVLPDHSNKEDCESYEED